MSSEVLYHEDDKTIADPSSSLMKETLSQVIRAEKESPMMSTGDRVLRFMKNFKSMYGNKNQSEKNCDVKNTSSESTQSQATEEPLQDDNPLDSSLS